MTAPRDEGEAILAALSESPGDALAQSAYADWLEEQGRTREAQDNRHAAHAAGLRDPSDPFRLLPKAGGRVQALTDWPAWARSLLVRMAAGKTTEADSYWLDPTKVMTAAGMTPDPWQARVLRSTARNLLACCGRQFGKSAVFGALAARTAIVEAPALVLVLSASQRQSAEFFDRHIVNLMRKLDWPVKPARKPNVFSLELANGSRIIALPDNQEAIVGYSSVDLLMIDEASRVSDALFHYTSPMLAVSKGRFAALSTPMGKRGWFYEQWDRGLGYERHSVTIHDGGCPRITPEFIASERARKPPRLFAQEYEGAFNDVEDAYFPEDDIRAALAGGGEPLFGGGPLFGP